MILKELYDKNLVSCPKWVADNIHYLTLMGSVAYGVSTDTSDMDIYGWCIPPKDDIFPHLRGEILGFGYQKSRFEQWQQHHILDPSALGGKGREYDFTVYSIVKFFRLCMENNPNMVDALFVDQTSILHTTNIGDMVREKRHMFLHKGCWHKFKGYAYQQLNKANNTGEKDNLVQSVRKIEDEFGIPFDTPYSVVEEELILRENYASIDYALESTPDPDKLWNLLSKNVYKQRLEELHAERDGLPECNPLFKEMNKSEFYHYAELYKKGVEKSGRFESRKNFNVDVKFLYHIVRLLSECQQILETGTLDLMEEGRREHMKAIRRGEIGYSEIKAWFKEKQLYLENLYANSKLPTRPDEQAIKELLLNCIEEHYGSLEGAVVREDELKQAFREMCDIVEKHKDKFYK